MKTTTKTTRTLAMAAIAGALAGALSLGTAAPALAEDTNTAVPVEEAIRQSNEQGWDASADEGSFGADADTLVENDSAVADDNGTDGANATDLAGAYGPRWWYRRVNPQRALWAAEDYFDVDYYDDWDYQVGRYRGIPAYRVTIDDYRNWRPYDDSDGHLYGTRYVAFVNYFTGRVIDGYVTRL
jgi:uncharacterized low-complexity protein